MGVAENGQTIDFEHGRKWSKYWFWSLDNRFNGFLVSINIELKYDDAYVEYI